MDLRSRFHSIPLKGLFQLLMGLAFCLLLIWGISHRIAHAYLEDDLLWFMPLLTQIIKTHTPWEIIELLHIEELTLSAGIYFSTLISFFGFNFKYYLLVSLGMHLINAILFYRLLKNRIKLSTDTSFTASLIYLVFYGHFHAYTFPLSFHLLSVFFIFLILYCYLKMDELIENDQPFMSYYYLILFLSFLASFLRLSVLMIPLIILVHMLFSTKDKRKIIMKYNLWMPIFTIFIIYQSVLLVVGGYGDVLSQFLKPINKLFGDTRNLGTIFFIISLSSLCLILIRSLIRNFLKNKSSNPFYTILGWLSLLILGMPKILSFYLLTFMWPLPSAFTDHILHRWQILTFPQSELVKTTGLISTSVLIMIFLWYMTKKKRHLMIFVPWYVVSLYFLSTLESISSRYLIYLTPIFSVIFCLSLVEVPLNRLARKFSKGYISIFYIFIFAVLIVNIVSIRIRLLRTMIVDYHWSYDYIKIANLIKHDILNKTQKVNSLERPICISGIKDIPYRRNWEKGFLRELDFEKFDSFRQTLISALNHKKINIFVNDERGCGDTDFIYRVNDFTVIDQRGESIEPFYRLLYRGLKTLREGDHLKATAFLEQAIDEKPFLIRFMTDPFLSKGKLDDIFISRIAEVIYALYATYFDDDEKINYIDNMIQKEAQDYGVALALTSYLKKNQGQEKASQQLFKKAVLFVSKENIYNYPLDQYLSHSEIHDFQNFLEENDAIAYLPKKLTSKVKIESYKGFNIFWYADYYLAIPQEEKDFDLVKFKGGECQHCFAKTRHAIRRLINSGRGNDYTPQKVKTNDMASALDDRGFKILKFDDLYFCFNKESPADVANYRSKKGDFLFKTRTLLEAKLIIDTFFEL